jgi:hypothetical protein
LERETCQRQQHDVVVLHHVLRVVQVRGAEQQRQNAGDRLFDAEPQLAQETEAHQRRQNIDQDVGAVADENRADCRIGVVVCGKERQLLQAGADHVRGQHEQ